MINSISIHKANIVFIPILAGGNSLDNSSFTSLITGDAAVGINFVDDPTMDTKLLTVPKLGVQIAWEAGRLRIEDQLARDPEDSPLPSIALNAFTRICVGARLQAYGFNFSVYYQNSEVIRMSDYFSEIAPGALELGTALIDFGWQWTIQDKTGERLDGYFLKVASPLELAVLHNTHFKRSELPSEDQLKEEFKNSCTGGHTLIKELKL